MLYTDDVSSAYASYSQSRSQFDELRPVLERHSISGKDILDVGCGSGQLVLMCKEMGSRSVTGIDLSESMIKLANEITTNPSDNIKFVLGDAADLPFKDESVDVVVSSYAIQHVPDTNAVFAHIARVLRPSGLFIGTLVWTFVEKDYEHLYGTEFPIIIGEGKNSVTVYDLIVTPECIMAAIAKAGLEVVESNAFGPDSIVDPSYPNVDKVTRQTCTLVLRKPYELSN